MFHFAENDVVETKFVLSTLYTGYGANLYVLSCWTLDTLSNLIFISNKKTRYTELPNIYSNQAKKGSNNADKYEIIDGKN